MKESRLYNRILIWLMILLGAVNLLNKSTLGLPPVDYGIYAVIAVLTAIYAIIYCRFMVPGHYLLLITTVAVMMVLNAIVSKYSPEPLYSFIGGLITLLPFILFVMCYNFRMDDGEIHQFINLFIALVCFYSLIVYADSFILGTGDRDFQTGILASGIVRFGDFSSLCNQALVLTMAEFYRTRRKSYLGVAAWIVLTILLTNQLKAILGMMLIFTGYVFYLTNARRWVKITISSLGLAAIIVILSVSASFMLKFENYLDSNTAEDAYAKIARPALYYRAFEMAADFFPFGTGQGTYGSVPVNIVGSRVYSDYELDKIWGLGDDTDFSFKMDAHWASILGEMGYIGALIYLLLFFYPAMRVGKRMEGEEDKTRRYYIYIIRMGILTLFAESIVLALPKSFSFMIIYAGLAGLIMNRKSSKTIWTDR